MNRSTLEIIFKIFEFAMFMGLSVISIILSWEALVKFQSMDTNLKQRHETVKRFPTLTICPNQDGYAYGKDFHFNIYDTISNLLKDKEHKNNVLKEGPNDEFGIQVRETISAYFGRCFRLIPTRHVAKKSFDVAIAIKFSNIIPEAEIPSSKVFFTSEINSIGIGRAYWYEGQEYWRVVPIKRRISFRLIEHEYKYFEDKSGCSMDLSWYECYAATVESSSFADCPEKCLAHSIHHNKSEKLRFCKSNTVEWQCSNEVLRELRKQIIEKDTCLRSCTIRNYEGTSQDYPFDHNNTIAFNYYFAPPYIATIHEEYLLFDFLGLISSVGGTLGIFIGFSIIAIISGLLSYILAFINKI